MKKEEVVIKSVQISRKTEDRLNKIATGYKLSFSSFVRMILDDVAESTNLKNGSKK